MKQNDKGKHRHAFQFKIDGSEGEKARVLKAWAVVRKPSGGVDLVLTAADVRRSMKLKGIGNTQTCSMALCAKRQANSFAHPVEGYIDWQYSRAYVVSKVSKETGLPTECYAYEHNDNVALLNDTKGGQKKLLEKLESDGDRIIKLYPLPRRIPGSSKAKPAGKKTGERAARLGKGAKLRFAMAALGGVAA